MLDSISQDGFYPTTLPSHKAQGSRFLVARVTMVQALMFSSVFLLATFSLAHKFRKGCQAQRDSCLRYYRPFGYHGVQVVPIPLLKTHNTAKLLYFILFLPLFYFILD